MPKKAHPFNIMLSPTHVKSLTQLAQRSHCSQAHVLRCALDAAYRMVFAHVPSCADGSRCYVPHMHPPASPAAADNSHPHDVDQPPTQNHNLEDPNP